MRTHQLVPYRPFASLRNEVDRVLEGFGQQMGLESFFGSEGASFMPTLDVVENGKHLKVTAELPGMEEKDVEVELTRNTLVLKGEKTKETEEEEDNCVRKERTYGSFYREIPLPWEVDTTKVEAHARFKKGVLTVKVPKPKGVPAAAKKVPITAG